MAAASLVLKPSLRGWMHEKAFLVAVPAAIVLVVAADGAEATVASIVYGLGLVAMYGVSAAYHRGSWSDKGRLRMQRLDHGTIYLMIAGTYTPMCLVVMGDAVGLTLLALVWVGAVGGFVLAVSGGHHHKLAYALYLVLGWAAVLALPSIIRNLDGLETALLLIGGILYTVGFVTLVTKWPHRHARRFGYHEVWHTFVVAASVCHYLLVWQVVREP